jgi:hypothetical protein
MALTLKKEIKGMTVDSYIKAADLSIDLLNNHMIVDSKVYASKATRDLSLANDLETIPVFLQLDEGFKKYILDHVYAQLKKLDSFKDAEDC